MSRFAILSAHRANLTPEHNAARTVQLRYLLHDLDFDALPVTGCYTHTDGPTVLEASFLVPIPEGRETLPLQTLALEFEQESILLDNNGQGTLLFLADGRVANLGRRTPGVAENYTDTPLGAFHYA